MTNQTITAISTPLGPGGIGIIRISGPIAYVIFQRLFIRHKHRLMPAKKNMVKETFQSHKVYYGDVVDPETGCIIDEVLAFYMKGPKSFTREDLVEIQSHSGVVVLDRILSTIVDAGASLAGPGEFTKRAFLNGRIDLSQAEAVIDLINAPCETAAQMASQQVAGGLRNAMDGLVFTLTALQARCEAGIEFADDVDAINVIRGIEKELDRTVLPEMLRLIDREKEAAIYREGVQISIAGVPNVGKSSLMNKLVEKETAIVSEFPGTTRDVVREYLSIKGIPVVICDTAGIHATNDPVECLGIDKARAQIKQAELVLMVVEGTRHIVPAEEKLLEEVKHSKTIVVVNKEDLVDDTSIADIENKLKGFNHIRVSAKFGTHLQELKDLIFSDLVLGKKIGPVASTTPNLRQRKILESASQVIRGISTAEQNGHSLEQVSYVLGEACELLKEISGFRNQEDLYDHIFSQFCIGK